MRSTLIILCLPLIALGRVTERKIEGRIVGGEPAFAGEFPFTAAIYVTTSDGSHFCGGSLISSDWILTAGQCVDDAQSFVIQLGSNNLNGTDSNRVTVSSSESVLHPGFNGSTLENDIGLIKLRLPIEYNDYIREVHYLPVAHINDGVGVTSIGWGQPNDATAHLTDALNGVTLATISNEECRRTYGNQITDDMLCASGNFNEGTCIGDTGSPLLLRMTYLSMHIGIASFHSGNGCDSSDPSGYTRTFSYIDWIRDTIRTDW